MSRDIFNYHRCLKPICQLLTKHRHRKLIGCSDDFIERKYSSPEDSEFYYKCKICGWVFFNNKINNKDLEKLKSWEE